MNKYSKKLLRLLITLNILNIINSQTVSSEYMREGFENIIKYKDSRNIIVAGLIISLLEQYILVPSINSFMLSFVITISTNIRKIS